MPSQKGKNIAAITGRPLSLARQRFVKEFIATGNASEAVRRSYPNMRHDTSVPRVHGARLLANGRIQSAISDALARVGVGEAFLTRKHKNLLNATRTRLTEHGEIEVPDNNIQLKSLELAYRVRGDLAPQKHEISFGDLNALQDHELDAHLGVLMADLKLESNGREEGKSAIQEQPEIPESGDA